MAAPRWRAALAAALLCVARLASGAPTSSLGDAGSQGQSTAPFKLLSTTPGSGNGADDGKVTATPWDIVVLTLTGIVVLICCGLGARRMVLQSAKEAAAMQAALAALGADREAAGGDDEPASAPRLGRSRERRGERVPALPAGDRQLPQYGRNRGSAASSVSQQSRIPAWRDEADDAALAASEAADVELVPMYTFTPERTADGGEWFVAPLAHLPERSLEDIEAPRRQRRERRRERDAPPPEPPPEPPPPPPQQGSVWGAHFGWG